MPAIAFFCQKCGSGNAPGRDACARCGTRLWLITEPAAARYEINHATPYEEHLLERISLLEHYIARLTERFDRILEVMLRQAQTTYLDHTLLESLIALLNGTEIIQGGTLSAIWQMRQNLDAAERGREERYEQRKQAILEQHKTAPATSLTAPLDKALALIEENPLAGGRQLEQLLPLSPQNSALLYLLGECFYEARKPVLARDYLAQSAALNSQHGPTQLLLGLVLGDQGESGLAEQALVKSLRMMGENVPARYALGRLAAASGQWHTALGHFKAALAIKRSEELLYVIAYIYYALNKRKLAMRFMRQILDNEVTYPQAWYWLGYWAWQAGEMNEARELFRAAAEAAPDDEFYHQPLRRRGTIQTQPLELKPFGATRRSKKIISSGDPRLAVFVYEAALQACRPLPRVPNAPPAGWAEVAESRVEAV